jgi:hypothetical protein
MKRKVVKIETKPVRNERKRDELNQIGNAEPKNNGERDED